MRFELFRAIPEDLDRIEVKDCYSIGEVGVSKVLAEMSWMGKSKDSVCLGFASQNKIYGIAGSYRSWAGSAQAWAVFSKEADKYPIALTKICESLINYTVKEQELRRLSLTVASGYTKGTEFAKTLGFEFEGLMRAYLPDGRDANLYARLF